MPSLDERTRFVRGLARAGLVAAMVLLSPARASAHFMITAPSTPPQAATVQSWMSEDSVGGPQKNGPCAATPNTSLGDSPGTPTNAITVIQPGQKVTIPITITIGHPGWFRIALHEGPSSGQSLTTIPDPVAQSGTMCTPAIMSNPVWSSTQPVLADGLPAGSTASTQQSGTKTFQVTIPSSASCSMAQPCSLQVVMVMTDHPVGDCYYHHCADVAIASGPVDAGNPGGAGGSPATGGTSGHGSGGSGSGGSGSGGTGSGGTGSGGSGSGGSGNAGGSPGTGGTASGGNQGAGGSATGGAAIEGTGGGAGGSNASSGSGGKSGTGGQPGGTTMGTGGSNATGPGASGSSGCSCALAAGGRASWAGVAFALALVIARRRRRGTRGPS